MSSCKITISSKYQVVIPKAVRKALGLRPGDQLLVQLEDGKIVMRPRPQSYTKHLRGLHKNVWKGLEATEYVKRERESWER
ncbi:AbrB/MazE/SpoVT family DNA-binding domain-containing protein [Candidatus Acetothermia bacterium]|nr:AbrB/MazE/SpoVT family DNA-binding domain-containing protein [Candidatus Acetothermia bacterium]MBI3659298.1 AbrB/MazE/SpoVT family DNA-binding domain-containing protein [Candidatus Acetothermia bacterium]